jgi:hypothetical protein
MPPKGNGSQPTLINKGNPRTVRAVRLAGCVTDRNVSIQVYESKLWKQTPKDRWLHSPSLPVEFSKIAIDDRALFTGKNSLNVERPKGLILDDREFDAALLY